MNPELRILFAGSDNFSRDIVEGLLQAGEKIAGVLTAPDKPRGRSLALRAVPFADRMARMGLPVLKLSTLKSNSALQAIKATEADVLILASYGKIIPTTVLDLFAEKALNIHPSLLPRYRGAAPVQRALMDGVRETGVTVIRMTEEMDAGPILAAHRFEVGPDETAGDVLRRAAEFGRQLILSLLARLKKGETLRGEPQDEREATFAPKILAHERYIAWSDPAERIHNLVRALNPHPMARAVYRNDLLKILRTRLPTGPCPKLSPGVIAISGNRVFVGTGTNALELIEVHREGRRPLSAYEWAIGARLASDARFGS
ncbi:MAG: methionyl-tRNA formyltransferase [bacterium JZ-2024 1]